MSRPNERFRQVELKNYAQWYYWSDYDGWQKSCHSDEIEKHYALRKNFRHLNYFFDFGCMTQTNFETDKERQIKREVENITKVDLNFVQPCPSWVINEINNQHLEFHSESKQKVTSSLSERKLAEKWQEWIESTCMTDKALQNFEIKSFKPVKNPPLAARFVFQQQWMKKLNKNTQMTIAFHGTSSNDPEKVAKEGLNILLSGHGMKGKGLYFASDPTFGCSGINSYWHYKTDPVTNQKSYFVLVCAIIVGTAVEDENGNGDSIRFSWQGSNTYEEDCIVLKLQDQQFVAGILELVEKKNYQKEYDVELQSACTLNNISFNNLGYQSIQSVSNNMFGGRRYFSISNFIRNMIPTIKYTPSVEDPLYCGRAKTCRVSNGIKAGIEFDGSSQILTIDCRSPSIPKIKNNQVDTLNNKHKIKKDKNNNNKNSRLGRLNRFIQPKIKIAKSKQFCNFQPRSNRQHANRKK
jgi:hypothetical protein